MPLLRKTGVRSAWLPSPLQGALERVQPALIVAAILPSFALGGTAQFVGRPVRDPNTDPLRPLIVQADPPDPTLAQPSTAWIGRLSRAADTSNPPHSSIVIQQGAPASGAFVWMPRPLDNGVVAPPDRLSPTQIASGQQPQPGPSFWLPTPLRVPNTDPLHPLLLIQDAPDPTLQQPSTVVTSRLARVEDTSRPARPLAISSPPVPVPSGGAIITYAPRDIPAPPPDRLALTQVISGQTSPPLGGVTALRPPRDVATPPDRVPTGIIVQVPPVPRDGSSARMIGRITATPSERPPQRSPIMIGASGLPPPASVVAWLRAVRDGVAPLIIGPGHSATPPTRQRSAAPGMQRTFVLPAGSHTGIAPAMQRTFVLPSRDRTFSEETT